MADETRYRLALFERLEPRTPWTGGRIMATDILTLEDAARFASVHAGREITPGDFLRAAARGEILLRAIVHRSARTRPCAAGVEPLNDGEPVPAGAIPTLPLGACQALAAAGRASWRTFERSRHDGAARWYFDAWELAPGEPPFETVPADCRVTASDAHALADAFLGPADANAPSPGPQAPNAKRWTPERIAEARALVARLKAEGERAPMKVAALHFGVSPARLREVFRDSPEPRAAGAHWPPIATKRHRIK